MKQYILAVVVLALMLGLVLQGLPSFAQEPQRQEAPRLPVQMKSLSPSTGFIPPPMDLSHLTGQGMPDSFVLKAPSSSWDWRTQGKVTPVGDQGGCGACYAFASIGNIESKMLIDDAGTYDFSENNAKECNWYETADINGGTSCSGGNYLITANLFSKKGTVLESCDPYVSSDVNCEPTCPYQKTLLDWRIICGNVVPSTSVLKDYIQTYGPVYTSIYAGVPGTSWGEEFVSYDGSYTLYYDGSGEPNHAVLIVGWDDSLAHAGGSGGWIVKNSWGIEWGGTCGYGSEKGYFTIAYGSANIGMYSSSIYDWQDYNSSGGIMFYDEGGWSNAVGYGSKTAWGLCKFIPSSNTHVTRVEFWTTDVTTDVDVYIYDDFDGMTLSNLLASDLDNAFSEAGYHSVALDPPLAVTSGDDVIAVVKFTNYIFTYPIPVDVEGLYETERTYSSSNGSTWLDEALFEDEVAIRLRTSTLATSPTVTTNDASNIGINSSTLNGNLDSLGTASTVDVSFEWGQTSGEPYLNETTPETMGAVGPFSFELGDLSPNTTYYFRAKAVGDGTSYGLDNSFATQAEAGASVTRTLPVSVDPGADFDVSIEASGCGSFGQVVETLPSGFSYVGTASTKISVTTTDNIIKFTFIGDSVTFTYTVKALTTAGTYTFSGIVKDADKVEYTIGGDTSITVGFDPMDYDADEDVVISKTEALNAVVDYFDGVITKEQALEVITLYFT